VCFSPSCSSLLILTTRCGREIARSEFSSEGNMSRNRVDRVRIAVRDRLHNGLDIGLRVECFYSHDVLWKEFCDSISFESNRPHS
jgi:hypothetical protein